MNINCKQCKKEFKDKHWNNSKRRTRFCSLSCFGKYKKENNIWNKGTEKQKLEHLMLYFNKYVIVKDGCWGWRGSLSDGYGCLFSREYSIYANRASWVIHRGNIPDGFLVLHKCDNRSCTNPDHLFLGTSKDNTQDMMKKNRGCAGEKSVTAKLTIDKVREIRQLLSSTSLTQRFLANKFGVTAMVIHQIKYNKTWKGI